MIVTRTPKEGIWRAALQIAPTIVIHVPQPGRHHHCVWRAKELGYSFTAVADAVQGFMTTTGRFVGREEALLIARARGQMKPRLPGQYDGDELFSEDVW
jgi:hypothetical protein